METRTYSKLLSWLTGWGALDQKKLQEDVDRLTAFYYDNGYLNVQIAPPQVQRSGGHITIIITIDEGTPYRVGHIDIEGNLKFPRRELRKLLTMKSGQLFRGSSLQRQVLALSDFYSNRGYAYVNVDPRTQLRPHRQAGQRGVRDQSRPRSADRPHQYQRQHQDLRQGNPPRDPGAGAGAVQRRRDPRFAGAAATAGILQRHAHHDRAGVAARQDRPRRERDRGATPRRSRWRAASTAINRCSATSRWATPTCSAAANRSSPMRRSDSCSRTTASVTPSRGSWTSRSSWACSCSTTKPTC